MTDEPSRHIAEISVDTQLLVERLRKVGVGETISYAELTGTISRDVQGSARGNLYTARRTLQRDDNVVFGVVVGEGMKRLNDSEIVSTATSDRVGIRRRSRRAARRLACVQDFDSLPSEAKIRHQAAISLFGVISAIARNSETKRLEAAVEQAQNKLPVAATLAVLGKQ